MSTPARIAIVTGAGTGIGKAVAIALLKDGYSVVLAGRRVGPLEQAVKEAAEEQRRLVEAARVESQRMIESAKAQLDAVRRS